MCATRIIFGILHINFRSYFFAFAYRLFHEDFSLIYGALVLNPLPLLYTLVICMYMYI